MAIISFYHRTVNDDKANQPFFYNFPMQLELRYITANDWRGKNSEDFNSLKAGLLSKWREV